MKLSDLFKPKPTEKRNLAIQASMAYFDNPTSLGENWLLGKTDPAELIKSNPIAWKCVDRIAKAVMDYEFEVYVDDEVNNQHPLFKAVNGSPVRGKSMAQTKYAIAWLLKAYGEAYPAGIFTSKGLAEIQQVYARGVAKPLFDKTGLLLGFKVGQATHPIDPNGRSDLWRIAYVDPIDQTKAMSEVEGGSKSIEENNTARDYIKGMLRRFGRRPAVMVLPEGAHNVTPENLLDIKESVKRHFENDPEGLVPLQVSGGVTYQELGASLSDMKALENRDATSREICFLFGVPPMLMGISGDSTYSNQREANASFYKDTVRPLVNLIAEELSNWIAPYYTNKIELRPDVSQDPYAIHERDVSWQRVAGANGLSINEKRALMGYGPISEIEAVDDGDEVLLPSSDMPLSELVQPVALPDANI